MRHYLDFGVIVVHDVVVGVAFLLVDFEEVGDLLGGQLFSLVAGGFVVHHLVELTQGLGVVLVYVDGPVHFSSSA